MYGNNPRKLLVTIIINRERNIRVLPLKDDGPKRVLNSLCSTRRILLRVILSRLGINHKEGTKIVSIIILLSQFDDELIEEAGSKTENKFVIIFILNNFFEEFGYF